MWEEVSESITSLQTSKAPGPDGLPSGFFKLFRIQLVPILASVYNKLFRVGSMTPSMRQARISLVQKVPNPKKVADHRPISLSDYDYKILTRILTARYMTALEPLIGNYQSYGLRNRSICDNLDVSRFCFDHAQVTQTRFIFFQADVEKAFDRVSHEFLLTVLKHVGVGDKLLSWAGIIYWGCRRGF